MVVAFLPEFIQDADVTARGLSNLLCFSRKPRGKKMCFSKCGLMAGGCFLKLILLKDGQADHARSQKIGRCFVCLEDDEENFIQMELFHLYHKYMTTFLRAV